MSTSPWPAILFAWIAGFVDALGYLVLANLFTAHMSGNSAALGAHLGTGDWQGALFKVLPIPAFVLGVALGASCHALARRVLRSGLTVVFALEAALLLVFLALAPADPAVQPARGSVRFLVLVWTLALAMGVQSASLRTIGQVRVRTTFVSGMLTNMASEMVLWLGLPRSSQEKGSVDGRTTQRGHAWRAAIFGAIYASFLLGAVSGGFGECQWGPRSLLAPIGGLMLVLVLDLIAPFTQN